MRKDEFLQLLEEHHLRMVSLTKGKGEEYSRDANQFANFERGAKDLGILREQVLLVYLSKHMDSIKTIVKSLEGPRFEVYSEPPESRIDDAILYLLLLKGMFREYWPVPATGGAPEARWGGPVSMAVEAVTDAEAAARLARARLAGEQRIADRITKAGGPKIDMTKDVGRGKLEVVLDFPYTPEELGSIVMEWADETFGVDRDENSTWKKLFEELGEVIRNPDDPAEWADVMILMLDLAARHSVKLTPAILAKMEVLRGRVWETRNGVFSHVNKA